MKAKIINGKLCIFSDDKHIFIPFNELDKFQEEVKKEIVRRRTNVRKCQA